MKKIILINSIVWAAMLIALSLLFKDHQNWKIMFIAMISASVITNGFLVNKNREKDCKHT